jgi:uncharacterized membrane protein
MAEQPATTSPPPAGRRPAHGPSDEQVEQFIGNLLRTGVILAALVVLAGGVRFLARHGDEPRRDYQQFREESAERRGPVAIVRDAGTLQSGGLIQLGLLLLIATPVARVVFSVFAFARQRDLLYVLVTLIVLVVLLSSLFSGYLS